MNGDKGNATTSWPAAMVAVALIALVGTVIVAAIFKYPSVKEALEIWGALTAIVGVLTGAFVTYFFTQNTVNAVQDQRNEAEERAKAAESTLKDAAGYMEPHQWANLVRQLQVPANGGHFRRPRKKP